MLFCDILCKIYIWNMKLNFAYYYLCRGCIWSQEYLFSIFLWNMLNFLDIWNMKHNLNLYLCVGGGGCVTSSRIWVGSQEYLFSTFMFNDYFNYMKYEAQFFAIFFSVTCVCMWSNQANLLEVRNIDLLLLCSTLYNAQYYET